MSELSYLKNGLKNIHIELEDAALNRMLLFKEIVLKENQLFNLTSITDDSEFIEQHLIDSLTILPYLKNARTLIDIGTGAGFPGMVLKIAMPDLNLTLLDSVQKKVNFLKKASDEINLNNVVCMHARAEDMAKDSQYREKFDVAVSRAVSRLSAVCELCIPFVQINGKFIAMKGKNITEELGQAGKCHEKLGCKNYEHIYIELPYSKAQRNIFLYSKNKNTPLQFPRNPKQIKDRPLS